MESEVQAIRCEALRSDSDDGPNAGPRRVTHVYRLSLDAEAWIANLPANNLSLVRVNGLATTKELAIAVRAVVRHHPFLLGPTSVVLSGENRDSAVNLRFWSRDGRRVEVVRAESSTSMVAADVAKPSGDRIHEVLVRLIAGQGRLSATTDGILKVWTKDETDEPYCVRIVIVP